MKSLWAPTLHPLHPLHPIPSWVEHVGGHAKLLRRNCKGVARHLLLHLHLHVQLVLMLQQRSRLLQRAVPFLGSSAQPWSGSGSSSPSASASRQPFPRPWRR